MKKEKHENRLLSLVAATGVVVIALFEPLLLVAAFCFGVAAMALVATFGRRSIKNQSLPVLPEEIEGRIFDWVIPGSGTIYLRIVCLGMAVVFLVMGGLAIGSLFEK